MTFTHALSTNNYGPRKFVVATSSSNGTHTTLASAMSAASVGDTIELRDSVTENVTITPGVNITGPTGPSSLNVPSITGTLTMSGAGTSVVSNVRLVTNSVPIVTVSGSAASQLFITNCFLSITNNTAISYTSSSGSSFIEMTYCQADFSSGTGIALHSMTSSGRLNIRNSSIRNTAGTSTASDNSAGIVQLVNSDFNIPFSTSSTGAINVFPGCNIDTSATNTISVLANGTGGGRIDSSEIVSGSASAVSIGAGVTYNLSGASISSTNTNPVTGAGTLSSGLISFRNTGNTVNTTTRTARFSDLTAYRAPLQPAFLATANLQSNVTGDGTVYTILYANEIFDQGSNFSSPTFTAPITGRYQISIITEVAGLTSAMTTGNVNIVASNRTVTPTGGNFFAQATAGAVYKDSGAVLMDMDAADTFTVTIQISNGTLVADIDPTNTIISAFLAC